MDSRAPTVCDVDATHRQDRVSIKREAAVVVGVAQRWGLLTGEAVATDICSGCYNEWTLTLIANLLHFFNTIVFFCAANYARLDLKRCKCTCFSIFSLYLSGKNRRHAQ